MKHTFMLLLLAVSCAAFAQKNQPSQDIKALKMDKAGISILSKVKSDAFTLTGEGTLEASGGYAITFDRASQSFIIRLIGSTPPTTTDGNANIGGGYRIRCYGADGRCDSCLPDFSGGSWYCKSAGCSCLAEVKVPKSGVQQVQTPNGDWRPNLY